MGKYKLGVDLGMGYGQPVEVAAKAVAAAGFDACFTGWGEGCDVEGWANTIARAGLIYQSIHSPFTKVHKMWEEGDEGEAVPVKAPLYFPVIGNIIALVIFKGFFGGLGKNIFNPAAAGRVILGLLFSALTLTMFTGTGLGENVASPLSYFMVEDYSSITIRSMFFGTASGAIGTVSIICILISGIFLMCFSITDYFIPVASIVTYVITVWLLKGPIAIVPYLFTGSFMFATMFMITDPTSSPTTTGGKFVYGLLFGVIAGLFRCFFVLGETSVFVAILCVNLLASLLDKIFAPRPLGVRRGK